MRKFVLVTAMLVASASAHAGPSSRSLTIGPSSNQQVAATADQSRTADAVTPVSSQNGAAPAAADQTRPAETPKYIHRPLAVDTTTIGDTPKADAAAKYGRRNAANPGYGARQSYAAHAGYAGRPGMMPHRRHHFSAGRIIAALHRYGIYW
jgi:hypothetical protein